MSTSSSLNELHNHVYFDENDFDDVVDLTESPVRKPEVRYPQLDPVVYPQLPRQQEKTSSKPPASSAPVPWSSSPPAHFEPPPRPAPPAPSPERVHKRKRLPWAAVTKEEDIKSPLPENKENVKYAWNMSASAVKDEQKEFRKRNRIKPAMKTTDPKPMAAVTKEMLSPEQQTVSKAVIEDGKSVFFTGSAGTGKSVLMRSIIAQFRHKFRKDDDRLAITASTGLAACVIEGQTLHSWAGIGLGKEPVPELVKKIKRNQKTKGRWIRTKVLVVDEISMVDGELFDKLEQIARAMRNNGKPFGGIQLVVTGDFFQLPPVPERNTQAKFAFDANTWSTCIEHTILLTHVFRQKDPVFAGMLNEMRLGKISQATIENFRKLSRPLEFKDEVEATEL